MDQRVSIITLGVADLKRSREFYERLGWRRSMAQAEGIVFFQAGGMALALFPRDELAKDANLAPDGSGFKAISLAYNTRDRAEVDSILKDAEAAGARLLKPAEVAVWAVIPGTSPIPMGFCGRSPGIHPSRWQRMEVFEFPNKPTEPLSVGGAASAGNWVYNPGHKELPCPST